MTYGVEDFKAELYKEEKVHHRGKAQAGFLRRKVQWLFMSELQKACSIQLKSHLWSFCPSAHPIFMNLGSERESMGFFFKESKIYELFFHVCLLATNTISCLVSLSNKRWGWKQTSWKRQYNQWDWIRNCQCFLIWIFSPVNSYSYNLPTNYMYF